MTHTLPPWRTACIPHVDIRANAVSEALFAVNLSRAIAHEGPAEYRDPRLFFERTHLTRTLQSLIRDVLQTLAGRPGANSVIHLQTNFGGGKTHAELALYHLLTAPEAVPAVPHLAAFLTENGVTNVPQAAVAALPCADLYAGGREVDGLEIRTLWGELAYRLGGRPLYGLLRPSDAAGSSPGVEQLRHLLTVAGPNVILLDELLHYVDKAAAIKVGDSNLGAQTLAFLRELTEAVDSVPHSILVASLTMSKMEDLQVLSPAEAEFTLAKLEDILRRVEDARTPIEGTEIYEIVRARLFQTVDTAVAAQVAATYAEFYRSDPWRDLLPPATRDAGYETLLRQAYPFHPSIVKVLYERWGSRPQFQLTRGTLRFLAHLLAELWPQSLEAPLIHLSDVDLADDDVRAEALRVAGSAWEAIIGADIAGVARGTPALAQRADRERSGLYARLKLVQGTATSVFMFTQGGEQRKPTPPAEVRLAVAQPALPLADLNQALDDCRDRLYYYYDEAGGLIFKTEPNPNKVLADERANITTDAARVKVEQTVAEVLGKTTLFNLICYGFHDGRYKEPGDVPDDDGLQLVVLPPRQALEGGRLVGRTADLVREIAEQYGKRLRFNRNRVLFLPPASGSMASAIDQAMDWLAALKVSGDAGLMERFSDSQKATIKDRLNEAANITKEHIRKAYNIVLIPSGPGQWEIFDLSYVPVGKAVCAQMEEDLLGRGKLHPQFNPALLAGRWAALWPATATLITTQALWEQFARQTAAPILTGPAVLQATIRQGVEQGLFGYGLLADAESDKLNPAAYVDRRLYFGPLDARTLPPVELSPRAVLLRPAQVDALFPPLTQDEVLMVYHGARQQVNAVFEAARQSPLVKGRVDPAGFAAAVCAGVAAGLFGYAETAEGQVQRGPTATLTPEQVHFSGWLIGEAMPLPITPAEVARLVPAEGRLAMQTLYEQAVAAYGAERVSPNGVVDAVHRCIAEGRFGYAGEVTARLQPGAQAVAWDGYVGAPELPPPDTHLIHLRGTVSPLDMAALVKTVNALSKLSATAILTLDLSLELKGAVDEHAVQLALREIQGRVAGIKVEEVKGK